MYLFKKGFTLAEVLITLLIVGIISSIVIPGIIADTQQAEYKTAWKKTYSSINQAYSQIMMDNGGTFVRVATNDSDLRNLFMNKMNYITTCDDTSCAASSLRKLNGTSESFYNFNNNLVLSDSTILSIFHIDSTTCAFTSHVGIGTCAWMMVDINGKKSPNQWGKDIYGIWILNNKILPWGVDPVGAANPTWVENTCSTSSSGYGCGSKYLYN
jgi:prepilin-type N-terminal cleavage/methylation domain-containing protein